jgi:hypothetical protein
MSSKYVYNFRKIFLTYEIIHLKQHIYDGYRHNWKMYSFKEKIAFKSFKINPLEDLNCTSIKFINLHNTTSKNYIDYLKRG